MFASVFLILFFVIGLVLFIKGKKEYKTGKNIRNSDNELVPETVNVPFRLISILPFSIFFLILILTCFTQVDGGHVGVKKVFGAYQSGTVSPGLHIKAPWEDVVSLDTKTQEYTMSASANEGDQQGDDSITTVASDQVTVTIDATVLFAVNPDSANDLLQKVGTDYKEKLVRPSARTLVRDKATEFDSVGLVTSDRQAYATEVEKALEEKLAPYGITIQDVQIRDMGLPQSIQDAINAKSAAAQDAQKKEAELRAASLDADIKRTNAKATADSQQIIACGGVEKVVEGEDGKDKKVVTPNVGANCDQSQLTPEFLQMQYIQALKELVDAPNNSTLVLPTDTDLTPLLNLPQGK
jgi:regulator of protease activity HflC (stomatin/prohibitin superfamily)